MGKFKSLEINFSLRKSTAAYTPFLMGLITHTNIVVDNFSYGKSNPSIKYIYFLTHFHSGFLIPLIFCTQTSLDHWQGITPKWNYGTIYCSPLTKALLLNRFPEVPDVVLMIKNLFYKRISMN